jgi:hypothetical protein
MSMLSRRSSRSSATARLIAQQVSCKQGHHAWTPTFCTGEFLCTICGARAYCPVCVSADPSMTLSLCAIHRKEQEAKEKEDTR